MDEFEKSVYSALNSIQRVIPVMSEFSHKYHNSHLSIATSDCLHLLDSTLNLLEWSLTIVQNPKVKDYGTGDVTADLKTWLSATLSNQATCMEELEDTNHQIAKKEVEATMNQVTIILRGLLSSVINFHSTRLLTNWVKPKTFIAIDKSNANVTVAADGSGTYTKIMDAITNAPKRSNNRYVIHIKTGSYREQVQVNYELWNIAMVGDGIGKTIITGDHSNTSGYPISQSATFGVDGQKFVAINITFENTAGEVGKQAVALRSGADQSIFYGCEINGHQDTLYAQINRQFYRECTITGTVDFICGDGTVVFQDCKILTRQRQLPGMQNTITAQKREDPNGASGFSFDMCTITGDSALIKSKSRTQTFLGRPWGRYSRVVFMQSILSDVIDPTGWLPWFTGYESTVYYAEYNNNGPGSDVIKRVKWPGIHVIDKNTAVQFTVSQFIQGDSFIGSSNISYTGGLQL
ncbi:Pectinesterase [Quillaja saponaria]|uniref:Pectinesterase n=1 Tax=Quillaja saponaria TaxID=32244 RepID=A0AAD7LY73_QUISA|nr:Pectinesterase [Quillaja saponaria]